MFKSVSYTQKWGCIKRRRILHAHAKRNAMTENYIIGVVHQSISKFDKVGKWHKQKFINDVCRYTYGFFRIKLNSVDLMFASRGRKWMCFFMCNSPKFYFFFFTFIRVLNFPPCIKWNTSTNVCKKFTAFDWLF